MVSGFFWLAVAACTAALASSLGTNTLQPMFIPNVDKPSCLMRIRAGAVDGAIGLRGLPRL